jgi:hypothetical protein
VIEGTWLSVLDQRKFGIYICRSLANNDRQNRLNFNFALGVVPQTC